MTKRFLIKYFLTALLLFGASYGSGLSAAPLFVYNHGYVVGELSSVDFVGVNRRVIAGHVLIGNSGFNDRDNIGRGFSGEYVLNNPWQFCGGQKLYDQLVSRTGELVIIEYRTPKKSSLLQCQSKNEIIGIHPISQKHDTSQVAESSKIVVANQAYGVSAGRIVNAQNSGNHAENWSIVIQVGNSGNDFRYLQIVDADIYALALDALASATKVKVFHVEQMHGFHGNNGVDNFVWKIETISGW